MWSRESRKLINVSECAKLSDCLLLFQFQRTVIRAEGFNPNTILGFNFQFVSSKFVMQSTPWQFIPQDALDNALTNPGEDDGKKIELWAACDCKLTSKITFELSKPEGVTTFRPGSSSNFGTQSPLSADYGFEASRNPDFDIGNLGQSMTTKFVTDIATAVVSSYDYGGVAILRAKVQVDGQWVYADSEAYDEFGELLPKATCSVSAADERPFVQIPIDINCNWIADSWEKPRAQSAQLGNHFPSRYWDSEKGNRTNLASTLILGDGFGAYDEYRGFHNLNAFGQIIRLCAGM